MHCSQVGDEIGLEPISAAGIFSPTNECGGQREQQQEEQHKVNGAKAEIDAENLVQHPTISPLIPKIMCIAY